MNNDPYDAVTSEMRSSLSRTAIPVPGWPNHLYIPATGVIVRVMERKDACLEEAEEEDVEG
jgi:hypothetical protein